MSCSTNMLCMYGLVVRRSIQKKNKNVCKVSASNLNIHSCMYKWTQLSLKIAAWDGFPQDVWIVRYRQITKAGSDRTAADDAENHTQPHQCELRLLENCRTSTVLCFVPVIQPGSAIWGKLCNCIVPYAWVQEDTFELHVVSMRILRFTLWSCWTCCLLGYPRSDSDTWWISLSLMQIERSDDWQCFRRAGDGGRHSFLAVRDGWGSDRFV